MEENKSSNRRSFVRKLLGLGAAAGATSLLLDKSLIPLAQAGSGTGATVNIDQINYGVGQTEVRSNKTGGAAFSAVATATTGYTWGVYGVSLSPWGKGVYGDATASTGTTYGVYGLSRSNDGIGVYGTVDEPTGKPIVAQGTTDQTASLQEWQDVSKTILTVVDKRGWLGIGTSTPAYKLQVGNVGTTHSDMVLATEGPIESVGTGANNRKALVMQGLDTVLSAAKISAYDYATAVGRPLSINSNNSDVYLVQNGGNVGVGTTSPARSVHLRGSNACFRMDRDANSSAFILVRTASGNFSTIWKTFYVGVDATGVDNGEFFIGDNHTNVSGTSTKRFWIDNAGGVHAPNFITGDMKLANDYKVTEDEKDGVAFLNPEGDKIAVLDRQGNFYVKGEFRQLKE